VAEQLSFPGQGGLKQALVARPAGGQGPGVVVVVPAGQGSAAALCAALARHGFVAASLEPSGASRTEQERSLLETDDLAALSGFLLVRAAAAGRAVGLVAFGAATSAAITVADALPDVLGALVVFSDQALDPQIQALEVPVQAHLRDDAAAAAHERPVASQTPIQVIAHPSVPTADELAADEGETLRDVAAFLDERIRTPA